MAKKVKIKNSDIFNMFKSNKINEGFFDFINAEQNISKKQKDNTVAGYKSVARNYNKSQKELEEERSKLWDTIMTKKKINLDNIYGKNNERSLSNNIFKISPRQMYDEFEAIVIDEATGTQHIEKIPAPAEIITLCEDIRHAATLHPLYGPIMRRFDKPIVWTLNSAVDTAASDGIRIAYNVIFAYQLIQQGQGDFKELKASGKSIKGNDVLLTIGKYWLFVYIHETYHELYEHTLQAERKDETANGKNHHMANIAMDAEINRDIENQIPNLKGCTIASGGIMDPNFPHETWDEIFDQYYYHNKPMPKAEPPMSGPSGSSNNNSQQQQSSNNTDSNQQQNNQQSQNSNNNSDNSQNSQSGQGDSSDQNSQSSSGDPSDQNSDSNNQKQSGFGSQSSNPSNMSNDSEYDSAYNDELQNIADNMNGKKNNKSSKPKKLSDKEINDIVQNMKDALANGMSMKDLINNNSNNSNDNGESDQKIDAESASKIASELANLTDLNGQTLADAQKELADMTMSKTEQAAREQAQKDVQDALDKMEKEAEESQQQNSPQQNPSSQSGKGTSAMPTVTTSSKFGGADMISKEDLSAIAEQEGQPYTASELTANRNQLNDDYIKENISSLRNVSSELANKIENIKDKLKDQPVITNWKNKLKKFLKNQAQGEVEQIRSKRVMSQTWRQDRYMPYKDRQRTDDYGAADVFYLIDNSGSMWGAGFGENIFIQIFSEILGIEKVCQINKSALTYFSGNNVLPKDKIRLWDKKTAKAKVLEMIPQTGNDQSGGTDIGGNVIAVTKLGKPYYYNTGQKHTLLIVFTDGEDESQYNQIKNIPMKYKKDLLFCLINRKSEILRIMNKLHSISGINLSNIICICTDEFNK